MQIHISRVEPSTTNRLACKVLHVIYHSPAGGVDDISSALVLLRGKKTLYILKDKEFELRDNLWPKLDQSSSVDCCSSLNWQEPEQSKSKTAKVCSTSYLATLEEDSWLTLSNPYLVNHWLCLVNKWSTPLTNWPSSPASLFLKTWAPLDSAHYSR